MRAFLAIELPEQLKKELHEYRNSIRYQALKGRWRHSDNFHLTLKFFNKLSKNGHNYLDALLATACEQVEQFMLRPGELGVFGGRVSGRDSNREQMDGYRIRTLWMGIDGEMDALEELYELTEEKSEMAGFSKERRKFSPHITLGQNIHLENDFEDLKKSLARPDFTDILVTSLFLFKSEQVGGKRVYTKISEYKLMK